MFQAIRSFVALRQSMGPATFSSLDEDHYLGFVGIPNPPADYRPPLGASPYTWPAIYNNMQNIDYCSANFKHIKTRMKCIETLTDGPLLP